MISISENTHIFGSQSHHGTTGARTSCRGTSSIEKSSLELLVQKLILLYNKDLAGMTVQVIHLQEATYLYYPRLYHLNFIYIYIIL